MSSSDPAPRRVLAVAAMLMCLAVAGGCTVQPLYGDRTSAIGAQGVVSSRLAMVAIKPARDRVEQEVRNHLIFLMGGGGGEPANPAYSLDLQITSASSKPATIETRRVALAPTSGIVTVRSSYRLTDARTGAVISAGRRSIQSSYDIPAQEYAALRAERDAENRAARELAELLRLVIAQELEKPTSTVAQPGPVTPEEIEASDEGGEMASF